jgi:ABC-type phosphate transport system substrate-binding protein
MMTIPSIKQILATCAAAACLLASLPTLAEIVLVANPKNPASSMTLEQASQFYLGISNSFVPLDYVESVPLRAEFYKKVTNKEPGQVRAIWAKLVFTGKGKIPREFGSADDMKKAIAADPNAIGYLDKAAVDGSVKVMLTVP